MTKVFARYSVFGVLLIAAGFLVSSFVSTPKAHKKDTYSYYVKGKVLDKATGVTLEDATVTVEHKHQSLGRCPSGESGGFELKWESAREYSGAELEFVITREGYREKRVTNVPLKAGAPIIVNFKIERKPVPFKKDPNATRWETIEYLKELNRY